MQSKQARSHWGWRLAMATLAVGLGAVPALAGEADIKIPDLEQVMFGGVKGLHLMYAGIVVCFIGLIFGLIQYTQIKNLPAHQCMIDVSRRGDRPHQ